MNSCILNFDLNNGKGNLQIILDSAITILKSSTSKSNKKNLKLFLSEIKPYCSNGKTNIAKDRQLSSAIEDILNNDEYAQIISDKTGLSVKELMLQLQEVISPGVITNPKEKTDESLDIEAEKYEQDQVEENERPTYIPYRTAVFNVFIGQYSAQQFLVHQFDENIFQRAFIDITTGQYIINNEELNRSIIKYKNILYNKIVDFLDPNNTIYIQDLYNGNGSVNPQCDMLLQDMQSYIQKKID